NRGQGNNAWVEVQLVIGEHRIELGMLKQVKQGSLSGQDNAIDEDVDEQPVQDLALNAIPLAHTYEFMANLSSQILINMKPVTYVNDKRSVSMSVVQSNVSYVPNDAYMMIFNDMHEPHAQSVSDTTRNTVVDNSLTAELATYKEQVELYERRARFELTEREQKIDEQLRIVITDRNIKEETLKKELHSVKMQLASTINHNKSMVEEVTSLKKDFKQKENKYLEEFLDMKALKEKVEDKLYKQDQSLQTVHMLCKPKPYYNEQNKVAIGYKNPLCLTRAKQVQPALYNGYEIIKNNHVPAIVHNTEDTLEIAEITRRKMNDKMKDPECVTHKVKIAPPDYSKENYLATFTPQKQLTPEQIFWSQDLIKMKAEALKEQTTASRPIKALTVYPPNKPATLVPRVLPTKSQGIQKALTNEIKEMKDVFEELEAEVDQNGIDRKHDEIERKNLLIAHDNLIADCLSKEVFYVATNSELNVSRFTEMHDAHTIVEARCLELEAELSNLQSFGNNPSTPAKDTPDFDSAFVIGKMKASLQGKDNVINKLKTQISHLQETRSEADRTLDFRALDFQITQLTKKITRAKHIEQTTTLTTEYENLKAQIQTKMKSSKDHVKPTFIAPGKHAIDVELIPPRNRNNREVHLDYLRHLKESVETLREIVEEVKVERPLDRNPTKIGDPTFQTLHLRLFSNAGRTDRPLVFGLRLFKTYDWRSFKAHEFREKFIGTVRFRNDHFGAIMGYGDYVIGDSVISRVYYVEGLGHNLFSVG
ncbi:hypothetical protein Tco_1322736, partial [Tanacetum coccineum]